MDKPSYLSILLISFPESLLIGIISILAIGKFSFFKDKKNLIRMLIFAAISAITSFYVKQAVTSEEALLVYLFLTTLLFIYLLRLKLYESILASIFGVVIQLIIEIFWIIIIQPFIGAKIDDIYSNVGTLFLLALPARLLQIALIYMSHKFKIKIIDLENKNIQKKKYYIKITVYVVFIGTFIFIAFLLTKILVFGDGNNASLMDNWLVRINIYLTLFVTTILTLAIKNTHEFYKNNNKLNNNEFLQNIEYISNLMEEENITEAKDAINSLKEYLKVNKVKEL
ncbi:hypothetical protein [Acetivibrio cellulolyticus]|uniref:hypothetical protein n=1 Tax=Acetivibrio cellulolyticus TaxID=35830 RepID=UPI0001E2F0BB|nr:hypothetical protein [Acetivibrio cellulolyticus]